MVKLDVISGFLGAGKTTLIKKLLAACAANGERVALIENEFGEVGIDGAELEAGGAAVYEISQGCVCCSLKGDFILALKHILSSEKPDRIIFEPSGIFILDEIFAIAGHPDIARVCALNAVITVVDAENYFVQREKYTCFFESQIQRAGTIFLSKSQWLDAGELQQLREHLQECNPAAAIIEQPWDEIQALDWQAVLTGKQVGAAPGDGVRLYSGKHLRLQNWSSRNLRPFSGSELEDVLAAVQRGRFGDVVRSKGFVPGENGLLFFSYAGGRYEFRKMDTPGPGRICFIGEGLQSHALAKAFQTEQS